MVLQFLSRAMGTLDIRKGYLSKHLEEVWYQDMKRSVLGRNVTGRETCKCKGPGMSNKQGGSCGWSWGVTGGF